MQRRKGFTLVELVVVIAVIAILAGVMIGTFASVINRANESAKMQELKAQEIEQKSEDILKKIEDSNWYGWEDFETSIVEKMTQVYKSNQGSSVSVEDIKVAVKAAIKEYTDSSASQSTSLTEEQVKVIIEDAIGKVQFNGVTEAQVRAIVSAATSNITATQLTASQVKSIVNAAQEKNLTAAQVAQVVGSLNLATTTNVSSAVTEIKTAIETAAAAQLTTDDLAAALIDLLPVTYKVAKAADLEKALASVNTFSTLNFTANYGPVTITLPATDNRTLTIVGVELSNLTVNAPVATIYLVSDAGTVKVESVADHSFHVEGKVKNLEINQGRAVIEEGAKVENLKAAPTLEALAKVVINSGATVEKLEANYQKNGNDTYDWIEVENNGTVGTAVLTVVDGTDKVTTNVKVTGTGTGIDAKEVADSTTTAGLVVSNEEVKYTTQAGETLAQTETITDTTKVLEGEGTEASPYLIRTVDELELVATLVNDGTHVGKYYKLTADLDISDRTWTPIGDTEEYQFTGVFDGNKKTINGLNNRATFDFVGKEVITVTSKIKVSIYGLFGWIKGTSTVKDLTLSNVDLDVQNGSGVGAIAGYVGVFDMNANIIFTNITVSGNLETLDATGGIAGRVMYTDDDNNKFAAGTVTFTNCTNNADITTTRDKYGRCGGIVGYVQNYTNQTVTITGCTNTGNISGKHVNGTNGVGQIIGYTSGDKGTVTTLENTETGNIASR